MCLKQSKKISVVKGKWRPKLMGEDIRGWLVSPRPCLRDDFVQNGITFFSFACFCYACWILLLLLIMLILFLSLFFFEVVYHNAVPAAIELSMILHQHLECWDYRPVRITPLSLISLPLCVSLSVSLSPSVCV